MLLVRGNDIGGQLARTVEAMTRAKELAKEAEDIAWGFCDNECSKDAECHKYRAEVILKALARAEQEGAEREREKIKCALLNVDGRHTVKFVHENMDLCIGISSLPELGEK